MVKLWIVAVVCGTYIMKLNCRKQYVVYFWLWLKGPRGYKGDTVPPGEKGDEVQYEDM